MNKPAKNNNPRSRKTKPQPPPPEIILPFDNRKKDMGEEIYDRRIPIFVTVIIYLVLSIVFVSSKIVLERKEVVSGIVIDLEEMERLQKELEEAKKLNESLSRMQPDDEPVRNVVSNEEGEVDEAQRDRPSAEAEDFVKQAQELERQMQETREMYEQGLIPEPETVEEAREFEDPRAKPIKVEGRVTVYYSLKSPARQAQNLFVPSYQCRKGGRVVVDIVVNQSGEVIAATVAKSFSVNDRCMMETAVAAAYKSRFNVHPGAPPKQEGRLIYTFVPQTD